MEEGRGRPVREGRGRRVGDRERDVLRVRTEREGQSDGEHEAGKREQLFAVEHLSLPSSVDHRRHCWEVEEGPARAEQRETKRTRQGREVLLLSSPLSCLLRRRPWRKLHCRGRPSDRERNAMVVAGRAIAMSFLSSEPLKAVDFLAFYEATVIEMEAPFEELLDRWLSFGVVGISKRVMFGKKTNRKGRHLHICSDLQHRGPMMPKISETDNNKMR
ncbi:hypothetical protein PIB30_007712 [Stylosanthes scabra]|uniref:Uncharacterized protein n=1 Tax=Stylosanthes scabra TaxID=79078 RepID=A0ABU6X206_9FABA|nr:hypothetical protein [Stylosanthes scabra]